MLQPEEEKEEELSVCALCVCEYLHVVCVCVCVFIHVCLLNVWKFLSLHKREREADKMRGDANSCEEEKGRQTEGKLPADPRGVLFTTFQTPRSLMFLCVIEAWREEDIPVDVRMTKRRARGGKYSWRGTKTGPDREGGEQGEVATNS